jgi:hypothetical protein
MPKHSFFTMRPFLLCAKDFGRQMVDKNKREIPQLLILNELRD